MKFHYRSDLFTLDFLCIEHLNRYYNPCLVSLFGFEILHTLVCGLKITTSLFLCELTKMSFKKAPKIFQVWKTILMQVIETITPFQFGNNELSQHKRNIKRVLIGKISFYLISNGYYNFRPLIKRFYEERIRIIDSWPSRLAHFVQGTASLLWKITKNCQNFNSNHKIYT